MDGISKVLYPIISIMYITGIQKTFIKQSVEEHIWYGLQFYTTIVDLYNLVATIINELIDYNM